VLHGPVPLVTGQPSGGRPGRLDQVGHDERAAGDEQVVNVPVEVLLAGTVEVMHRQRGHDPAVGLAGAPPVVGGVSPHSSAPSVLKKATIKVSPAVLDAAHKGSDEVLQDVRTAAGGLTESEKTLIESLSEEQEGRSTPL